MSTTPMTISLIRASVGKYHIGTHLCIFNGLQNIRNLPEAFRIKEYAMVYLQDGFVEFSRNGVKYSISAPCLIPLLPQHELSAIRTSRILEMTTIAYATEIVDQMNLINAFDMEHIIDDKPYVEMDAVLTHKMNCYLDQLMTLAGDANNPFAEEALLHLTLGHFYTSGYKIFQLRSVSRDQIIADTFIKLVHQYGASEHSLEFYANHMNLSPRYIQANVRRISGRTAYDWIEDEMLKQAKHMLSSTGMSMQQISNRLHFCNPSYFSAYFKRMCGMTPKEYRALFIDPMP